MCLVADAHEAVKAKFQDWMTQAIALRRVDLPPKNAPPQVFHEARTLVRTRMDQLEEILSDAMAMRGAIRRSARDLNDAAEDAWDDRADEARKAGRMDQYTAGRERAAYFNLDTRAQRSAARDMAQLLDVANEIVDRLWLKYNGLKATMADMTKELRYHQFESNLER